MDHYEIVNKLIGPIRPVGETNADEKRLRNLKEMITLIDKLLYDINEVSEEHERYEYSIREAGKVAKTFMDALKTN